MSLRSTFRFSSTNLGTLKKALRNLYPHIGSSHADEALVASLGFKSHAAMLAILRQVDETARLMIGADYLLLAIRLKELGYENISAASLRRLIWGLDFPGRQYDDRIAQVVKTVRLPSAANSS